MDPLLDPPDFPDARQGALLWVDAMRALGGLPPQSFKRPHRGQSWAHFASLARRKTVKARLDIECWLILAMADPASAALVQSRCGWHFFEDPFAAERFDYFDASDGAQIAPFLLDCPNERVDDFPNPMNYIADGPYMQGVWFAGSGPGGALECVLRAWNQMSALGLEFSHERQQRQDRRDHASTLGGFCPLGERLWDVIPQLAAQRQAELIHQAAWPAPARATPQRAL